ncbi:UV radiation resistance protein and autophagy-related subunit 14-domain-containing protein [Tricladium varicosporioides]|nr:UV radiation resistance protein and autophagy-related subunit 14-domain-containing protein [Hymenoscyphus varicosporioides]
MPSRHNPEIQCDICFRTGGHKLPLLCPTDARNALYESRIQNARTLLGNEALDQEVSALLANSSTPKPNGTSEPSSSRVYVDNLRAQTEQAINRTQQIIAHADELRAKVNQARQEIANKKAKITRRKAELASASNGVVARREKQLKDTEKYTSMARYTHEKVHTSLALSRTYLCGEAAKLYGLRRVRKNGEREEYRIGRVGIVDLRDLNSASAAQVSTALANIAHLLMLSMNYLAIRLPAEITLPHRDYPLPTIFPLASSHVHHDVPFPSTNPGTSNNSPTASRHEAVNLPRPRPLFYSKPLPILATEDPGAYGLFIEAVTLLAYDIAWVCRSQGIAVGEESNFDDICNIGRNLYNLLIGSQPRSPPSRSSSAQSTPTKNGVAKDKEAKVDPLMGKYSHGATHSFLGSAEGTEYIRSWKLLNPTKLSDRLKNKLVSEMNNKEWEILTEDAWQENENDDMADDGVVVGARKEMSNTVAQSFMSMRTVIDAVEMMTGDGERKPGTSGWTKLKPR